MFAHFSVHRVSGLLGGLKPKLPILLYCTRCQTPLASEVNFLRGLKAAEGGRKLQEPSCWPWKIASEARADSKHQCTAARAAQQPIKDYYRRHGGKVEGKERDLIKSILVRSPTTTKASHHGIKGRKDYQDHSSMILYRANKKFANLSCQSLIRAHFGPKSKQLGAILQLILMEERESSKLDLSGCYIIIHTSLLEARRERRSS